jgi:nucleoside-triphosphatase THEP1
MITIVAGKFNDHKTTHLIDLYLGNHQGDGFVQTKMMAENKIYGYNAMNLKTSEKRMIMIHREFYSDDFPVTEKIGPYLLHPSVKAWVEKGILQMIHDEVSPIYLDEIGVLELNGFGYDSILKKMVESGLDLVLAVREDLVDQVILKYGLKDVKIIKSSR